MTTQSDRLQQTPLYDLHLSLGAKMAPFAGYAMPIQYSTGILKEHQATRAGAGLFDVSHMGQVRLRGDGADAFLESLLPIDVCGLADGRQRYGFFTNENGGILDDLMVARQGDDFLLVINAACKAGDIAYMTAQLPPALQLEVLADRALLALQGPAAATVLERLDVPVADFAFMSVHRVRLQGCDCVLSRSGYSGEDGFEISVPADAARSLAERLLEEAEVMPTGLGARDSLRLEAGLCLYGQDLDEETTPVEAGLNFAIPKVRRAGGTRAGGFPGDAVILQQLEKGVTRRRVGLRPQGRAPVRADAPLRNQQGELVGNVTSGGFAASVGAPIAMGYVASASATEGTELQAQVRGRDQPITVAALPFIPHRYYRRAKSA